MGSEGIYGRARLPFQASLKVPSINKVNTAVRPHSNTNMEFPLHFVLFQNWKHVLKGQYFKAG